MIPSGEADLLIPRAPVAGSMPAWAPLPIYETMCPCDRREWPHARSCAPRTVLRRTGLRYSAVPGSMPGGGLMWTQKSDT